MLPFDVPGSAWFSVDRRFNPEEDLHEELDTLLALAEAEAQEATSDYRFTRVINDEFTNTEKSALLRAMWQVAFADGDVDKYEEHLIRKIAGLIYVPHQEFIRTRLQAAAEFEQNRG